MNALVYLFYVKFKAMIRSLFSKWSSGLVTIAAMLFFVFMFITLFSNRNLMQQTLVTDGIQGIVTLYVGFAMFMMVMMTFQKRTAIVTNDDANYIFAGPFSKKQVLSYLMADTLKGTLLYGLGLTAYSVIYLMDETVTLSFIIFLLIGSILMFYFAFGLITFFYFYEMDNSHAKLVKRTVVALVLIYIGILFGLSVMNSESIKIAITSFTKDPLFYFVPVFGWIKYGLIGVLSHDNVAVLIGYGTTFLVCIIITVLTVNIKGDFYEQAIQDAEWVTDLKQKVKENGNNGTLNRKISEVKNASFSKGAGAIASKNILIMKKTRNWIGMQEIIMIVIYLFMSYFMGQGFTFYRSMLVIVVMMGINADSFSKELKLSYIYLIPDEPLNKLINLVVPVILRMALMLVVAIAPCAIIFQVSFVELVGCYIQSFSTAIIFIAAGLWSVRLMKSNTTPIVETYLKMFIMLIATIPSLVVIVLLEVTLQSGIIMSSLIMMICNLIVGGLLIYSCKSMLNGTNVIAD